MKILQVSTHLNTGGIGSYILSLSSALKKRGVDVIVASSGGNLERELSGCGVVHKRIRLDTKFELSPKVFAASFALAKIIKDEKVDIIHAHSRVSQASGLFASGLTGVGFVTTCHGYFKKRFRGIFDTWGVKVIAISDAVRTHLEKDLGVGSERIELIYNGVDTGKFSRPYPETELRDMKKRLGIEGGPVIGTIGRLSPVKGQRFFIEAMRGVIDSVPGAVGLIVGSGGEDAVLKRLAVSLGISDSIRFVPSDPDTHKFLSLMDIFVLPSVKEGLGLALIEALAAGKPCVASRVGGIEDVISDHSNGLLVSVADTGAIRDAVLEFIRDRSLRKKTGELGALLVKEKFSIDLMADKMIELYKKAKRQK